MIDSGAARVQFRDASPNRYRKTSLSSSSDIDQDELRDEVKDDLEYDRLHGDDLASDSDDDTILQEEFSRSFGLMD